MTITAIDIIQPMEIVRAFGNQEIGVTEALKGDGHLDDGRFQDIATPWTSDSMPVLLASYLRRLRYLAYHGGHNLIEFWGWPEIRYRDDDNRAMVYSRVRFMCVTVVPQGRPN